MCWLRVQFIVMCVSNIESAFSNSRKILADFLRHWSYAKTYFEQIKLLKHESPTVYCQSEEAIDNKVFNDGTSS